jgi:hypothetical protein
VSVTEKEFIVLAIGDKDSCGYDERTLPVLILLVDSSAPDAWQFTRIGVVAYYVRSSRAVAAVEEILSRAERLRDTDARFGTLGIGLANGPMIADFDSLGRLKQEMPPLGEVANRASLGVRSAQTYREIFTQLQTHKAAEQ